MSTPNIVTIKNFSMKFGPTMVIKDLSFEVRKGEVFGFLGANGSGKTTTIRALLGIYQAAGGELLINGKRFTPKDGAKLGYLPEERGLYKKESVIDTMIYFGQLKNMGRAEARDWSLAYLERVGLADKAAAQLDTLSGGQQQKIQIGVTIMNQPDLLILDEPTKGFDPVNRRLMMEIIDEHRAAGATVILVTHQMEEVERLCDRIILLKDGTKKLYGTIEEIKKLYGSDLISLAFTGTLLADPELYSVSKETTGSAMLTPTAGTTPHRILSALTAQRDLNISKFEVQQASLDDIFIQIYSHTDEAHHA